MSERFGGVDVGARRLHCVAVDERGRILDHAALAAGDANALARWHVGATAVAIDAPAAPSTAPHAGCTELAPKFRMARCAEIELGRRHGSWVSWVAPVRPPYPGWIEAGFAAYAALSTADGPELLEVYPYAGFRELAGGRRLARKQSAAGRAERARLLEGAGLMGAALRSRSHDVLDASLAALVALDRRRRRARRVSCGHDDSAIWLPAA